MQGSRQSAGNWRTEEKLIDSYEKSTENRWIVGFTVLFLCVIRNSCEQDSFLLKRKMQV